MLIRGDAGRLPLRDRCVQCCVTSPPYWGLRDYGVTGQLGLEATPDLYVEKIVAVFREVGRVLKDDGTCWVNLGDSYAAHPGQRKTTDKVGPKQETNAGSNTVGSRSADGFKAKDLVGIPWRVAFALQADGWYLRADIIWHKPNPMPESVTDRPTKAHEYVFLLAKSPRYYYNADAIAETAIHAGREIVYDGTQKNCRAGAMRNKRSVWTINTQPYPEAHFATFPEALVEPCILAGCPVAGTRCDCDQTVETPLGTGGVVDDPTLVTGRAGFNRPRRSDEGTRPITRREQRDYAAQMRCSPFRDEMRDAAGPAFAHYIRTDLSGARPIPPMLLREWRGRGWLREPAPCRHPIEDAGIVLDPFIGSGTVGAVAERLGRRWVGVDLAYQHLATARTAQRGLRFVEAC